MAKTRQYYSRSENNPKSFVRLEDSWKYPNHLAIAVHRDGQPGVEFIILNAAQVTDMSIQLAKWCAFNQTRTRNNTTPEIIGEGF